MESIRTVNGLMQKVCQAKVKGCISHLTHTLFTPKISVAGSDMGIQSSPIWSEQCFIHLLKTDETGSVHMEEAGNLLPGQYPDNGKKQGGSKKTLSHSNGAPGGSMVYIVYIRAPSDQNRSWNFLDSC